jgi:hypothetical protein
MDNRRPIRHFHDDQFYVVGQEDDRNVHEAARAEIRERKGQA